MFNIKRTTFRPYQSEYEKRPIPFGLWIIVAVLVGVPAWFLIFGAILNA
jgi:hypothetical protein